jgi:uncharacterized protein (TIGR02996 family)
MDEDAFIRSILEQPEEDGPRLVYADWLEERGEAAKADYIRTEAAATRLLRRLRDLGTKVDPAWLNRASWLRAVVLENYPFDRKIPVLALVREVTGLGLKQAKDMVEALPAVILDGLRPDEAEQIRRRFDGLATVSVVAPIGPQGPPPTWSQLGRIR